MLQLLSVTYTLASFTGSQRIAREEKAMSTMLTREKTMTQTKAGDP